MHTGSENTPPNKREVAHYFLPTGSPLTLFIGFFP